MVCPENSNVVAIASPPPEGEGQGGVRFNGAPLPTSPLQGEERECHLDKEGE